MTIRFDKLKKDLSNIDDILSPIHDIINDAKDDINLEGKNIAVANVEQSSLIAYYDEIKSELKYLVDYYDVMLKKKRGTLYEDILNNFSKSLNDRAIDKLIDADKSYVEMYRSALETKRTYDKVSSIVNSLTQRSYSLNNLVRIYEHQLQDITLHE